VHATAASVGQQGTHTRTHTHTYTHTHAHAHTHTNTNVRECTHARTHIHAQTHRHTHTHLHTHAYAHTRCARDGLFQFFSVASNAPSLASLAHSPLCRSGLGCAHAGVFQDVRRPRRQCARASSGGSLHVQWFLGQEHTGKSRKDC